MLKQVQPGRDRRRDFVRLHTPFELRAYELRIDSFAVESVRLATFAAARPSISIAIEPEQTQFALMSCCATVADRTRVVSIWAALLAQVGERLCPK